MDNDNDNGNRTSNPMLSETNEMRSQWIWTRELLKLGSEELHDLAHNSPRDTVTNLILGLEEEVSEVVAEVVESLTETAASTATSTSTSTVFLEKYDRITTLLDEAVLQLSLYVEQDGVYTDDPAPELEDLLYQLHTLSEAIEEKLYRDVQHRRI